MNRIRRYLTGLLIFGLLFHMSPVTGRAESYKYTVTFHAGKQGSFGDVRITAPGEASVRVSGDTITVSGLRAGERLTFNAAAQGNVSLGNDSKYYVKGIRRSGRDNNTVGASSFEVEGDRDYVVAYGIRGEMTSYTVRYQDRAGNTLAPTETYYGNVGDRPVVAFLYVEGYEPQAYNMTGTLSANAADNVFTFLYSRVETAVRGESGTTTTTTTTTTTGGGTRETAGAAGNPGAAGNQSGNQSGANAASGTGNNTDTNNAAEDNTADGDDGIVDPLADNGVENIGEEEIPQTGPLEIEDLDDEQVPLAKLPNPLEEEGSRILTGAATVTAGSIMGMIYLAVWFRKRLKERRAMGSSFDQWLGGAE